MPNDTTTSTPPTSPAARWRRGFTAALAALVALNAIGGGLALVADPTGGWLGLPLRLLEGTPLHDYFLPGLLLAGLVGGTATAAAIAQWRGAARAGTYTLAAGLVLVGWMAAQFLIVGRVHALQPMLLATGVVLELLGAFERLTAPAGGATEQPPLA